MSNNEPLNANPTVHRVIRHKERRLSISQLRALPDDSGDDASESSDIPEPIDAQEVYDLLADINDPEHPLTLAQLAVVNVDDISINKDAKTGIETVTVDITPTIPHCSMATLIGLCVRVRLQRSLPARYRCNIKIKEGMHQSEQAVNRQLADKERVAAACENEQLLGVLKGMMESCA
ncbi:hypothetical protein PYCC9005_000370 [Savitreella phatthalungensis]